MADTLRIKRRAVGGAAGAPASLAAAELAYNEVDDILYYGKGDSGGVATTVLPIAGPGAFATVGLFNCGRLDYVSTTAISFKPYNGDRIKINGSVLAIPSAGIAGLGNTGVFVNGTAGQNLAAGIVYWVFAFSNAGVVTADFRTAATHAPSSTAGNVGTEILTGNDTRTLIGMVRTNASSQFENGVANRFVISWFNRRNIHLMGASTGGASTASLSAVEIASGARINFITWGEEAIRVAISGRVYNAGAQQSCNVTIWIDGALFGEAMPVTSAIASASSNAANIASGTVAEGFHYATVAGYVTGSTATYVAHCNALIRG